MPTLHILVDDQRPCKAFPGSQARKDEQRVLQVGMFHSARSGTCLPATLPCDMAACGDDERRTASSIAKVQWLVLGTATVCLVKDGGEPTELAGCMTSVQEVQTGNTKRPTVARKRRTGLASCYSKERDVLCLGYGD